MGFIAEPTSTRIFLERIKSTPDLIGFVSEGREISFRDFFDECKHLSNALTGMGIRPSDKIALLAGPRYEWILCNMAILGARAITVPIDTSLTDEDTAYILRHCDAKVLIIENVSIFEKLNNIMLSENGKLDNIRKIVLIDTPSNPIKFGAKETVTLTALKEQGRIYEGNFESNLSQASPQDTICISYTSGTIGTPKGVMLTHDNLVSVLEDYISTLTPYLEPEKEVLLTCFPFSQTFGIVEAMSSFTFGWRQHFAKNYDDFIIKMSELKPTVLFSMPDVFERTYHLCKEGASESSLVKKMLFDWAIQAGETYYTPIRQDEKPGMTDAARFSIAKKLVLETLSRKLGGKLRIAICGGNHLSKEAVEFFQLSGVHLLEGYGMMETCGLVTINVPEKLVPGSVGTPLPEVSLKISETGEILIKSRKIFKGYYKDSDATNKALIESWLHTGDIGHIDDKGFLYITDKKDHMITFSSGRSLSPQRIENLARQNRYINRMFVYGEKQDYLTALITLQQEEIIKYANSENVLFSTYAELVKNPKIQAMIEKTVSEINSTLDTYANIKKFIILPDDFAVKTGELTPSQKIRRGFVKEKYSRQLESMYQSAR